jgi:hypothetical protein
MSIYGHVPALAGAVVLGLGAVAVASAQDQSPPPGQGGPGARHGWDPAAMKERMEARRAEHAKLLHDALSIRPDQEAAFQAFTTAMTPEPRERGQGEHRDGARHELTTPERLDRMEKRMAEHQAKFQRRAEAIKAFYAALSPEQQRTFDALGALRGHGRGGHEGGRMGGRGGHEGPHGQGGPGEG